jgi:hypothetical protein
MKPSPGMITIGAGIIATMYLVPWIPITTILSSHMTMTTGYLPLAKYVEFCQDPTISCSFNGIPLLPFLFYIGWICAIILIIFGIFNKNDI